MYLERFNVFNQFILLDEDFSGVCILDENDSIIKKISGICDFIADDWLVLFVVNGDIILKYKDIKVDIDDEDVSLHYYHVDDGNTYFQVQKSGEIYLSLNYPSWWLSREFVVGLGIGSDDENDFCAYINYIMSSDLGRKNIRNVYGI